MFCRMSAWSVSFRLYCDRGWKINIALGHDSKCALLFLPSECKLFLTLLSARRGEKHIQCSVTQVNGCRSLWRKGWSYILYLEAILICSNKETASDIVATREATTCLSLQGSLVLLQILLDFYRGQTDKLNGDTFYACILWNFKRGTDCCRSPSLVPTLGYNAVFYLLLLLGRGKQFPEFTLGSHSTC